MSSPSLFPSNPNPIPLVFHGSVNQELWLGGEFRASPSSPDPLGLLVLLMPFPWTRADLHPPQLLESLPISLPKPCDSLGCGGTAIFPRNGFPNFLLKPLRKARPGTNPRGSPVEKLLLARARRVPGGFGVVFEEHLDVVCGNPLCWLPPGAVGTPTWGRSWLEPRCSQLENRGYPDKNELQWCSSASALFSTWQEWGIPSVWWDFTAVGRVSVVNGRLDGEGNASGRGEGVSRTNPRGNAFVMLSACD